FFSSFLPPSFLGSSFFAGFGASTGGSSSSGGNQLSTMVGAVACFTGASVAGNSVPSIANGPSAFLLPHFGGAQPQLVRTTLPPASAIASLPKQKRRGSKLSRYD